MSRAVALALYHAFDRRDFDAGLAVIDRTARWQVIPGSSPTGCETSGRRRSSRPAASSMTSA